MQNLASNSFAYYRNNIGKIIYITCIATFAIVLAERFFIIFSYEAHTAGIDNNFDYPIIRALAGFSIYPDPESYPYAVNPYAPLFFIICKWVASLLAVNPAHTISVYWISRAVCFLADLGTCWLFFKLLSKHFKTNHIISIAFTSLFFCIISFLGYTINRADSFFLFFYCGVIYALIALTNNNTIWKWLLPAILTSLCVFSKQNGIVLVGLVPAWFLIDKNYKAFTFFLLSSFILLAGGFLYFEFIYTDRFFSQHIINALNNKIDPQWFYIYIFKLIAPSYLTLPLAASLIISIKSISKDNHSLTKKIGVLCIMQFLFSTALSFKWGSSLGYYNESFFLGLSLIALSLTTVTEQAKQTIVRTASLYSYPAFFFFIIHMVAQMFFFFLNNPADSKEKYNEQAQISNYIKQAIGNESRYVIDLSNADFNFFKNMLFKEIAAPNIDAVNCCTMPDKIFDYSALINGLQNGQILFLIKEKDATLTTFWGVDIQHYKKDTTFKNYSIYKYDSTAVKLINVQ